MEQPPREPITPEEWEQEVYLTKVRDRLVLIKNRSSEQFMRALATVDTSDEFIAYGNQLEHFVVRGSQEARKFVEKLGVDFNTLISPDDVPDEVFQYSRES